MSEQDCFEAKPQTQESQKSFSLSFSRDSASRAEESAEQEAQRTKAHIWIQSLYVATTKRGLVPVVVAVVAVVVVWCVV